MGRMDRQRPLRRRPNTHTHGYPDTHTHTDTDTDEPGISPSMGTQHRLRRRRTGHLQRRALHLPASTHLAGRMGTTKRARPLAGQLIG